MRNINSVLINNSIKGSEDIFKTLDLLHKIGVIPTKKKRATKPKASTSEEGIRQDNDMGSGYAETKPSDSVRFPTRPSPSLAIGYDSNMKSIENLNTAVEEKKKELKALENAPSGFNNKQIEDIRRDTVAQLGLLTDKLEQVQNMGQYMGGALYSLGSRFGQIENKIRSSEDVPVGVYQPIDPFKFVEGSGDAVESTLGDDVEDEDIDMTNQGSQDIPENVMNVDVAPQPDEVLEDKEELFPVKVEEPVASAQAPVIDKFREVESFYGFALPKGKNQSVEVIKDYVKKLASESQTSVNYSNLKNRKQWEDKLNQLVDNQYQLIQSGDAVNFKQREQAVLADLELSAPSNKLDSQKAFLSVLSDKLGKSYKKSEYTSKDKVEERIKQLVNEHYKDISE
jgi:hypothetical protein